MCWMTRNVWGDVKCVGYVECVGDEECVKW